MGVCASKAPKLYSKQLVSYTSKHRKLHNTPNIAKNTKTPYIRPETSKTAFRPLQKSRQGPNLNFKFQKWSYVPPMHRNYTQNNLYHTQANTGNTTTPQTQPKTRQPLYHVFHVFFSFLRLSTLSTSPLSNPEGHFWTQRQHGLIRFSFA